MPTTAIRKTGMGEPAWQLAEQFPPQGHWDEFEYLALDHAVENMRTIELVDGRLEFLPAMTRQTARIVGALFDALLEFNRARRAGEVFFAGAKTKLREGEIRIPDILFALKSRRHNEEYFFGADLVMEVVGKSSIDRHRDLVDKRKAYAKAGTREYWTVDPALKRVEVLKLSGKKYVSHGVFQKGDTAASVLLKGFELDVGSALAGLKQ